MRQNSSYAKLNQPRGLLQVSLKPLAAYESAFGNALYVLSFFFLGRLTEFSYLPFASAYLGALGAYFIILNKLPVLSRKSLLTLLFLGFAARILFVFQEPLLSDDLYRCLWEGLVTLHGKNPYLLSPADPQLEALRSAWYHLINHADYPAIYPPVMILFNAAVAAIKATPFFYKSCLTLVDLALALVLSLRLKKLQLPRRKMVIYFLHPLPIIEISGNGHHEALVLLTIMTAFYFLDRDKLSAAAVWFSAAVLSKYFFLILISEFRNRRTLLILPALSLLLFAPFFSLNGNIFFSLGAYLKHWEFNASLYRLGTLLFADNGCLRLLLGSGYLLFWLFISLKVKLPVHHQRPVMLLTGLLLVSPTVHPWYGLWLLPFLVFYQFRAGLLFISLLPLSYIVLEGFQASGVWRENYWITGLIYTPLILALGTSICKCLTIGRQKAD
ncbi:MAG: hypothetical protein U9Q58_04305 [Pseudomonadota bacterium]|nr:hypothetical protein [Pseudomonadota bacterium]